jgi:hypothetical protein
MRRRSHYPRRNVRTGFSVFVIVIILAVAAGYAGTKYIIFPYLLGNNPAEEGTTGSGDNIATNTAVDVIPNAPSVIIDQQDLKNGSETNGNNNVASDTKGPFSVQFGSFSTQTGADEMSAELSGKGIYSYVYESGGSYKVLGLPYSSEGKAKQAAAVVAAVVSDVFVVNLSNIIP